ncbi:MAG: methyl-accepting chemotaxis protein [Methylococcales bacterium]|nr:methyl-accepting chemotaxis protein [Methylococcales bacterium]
MFKNMKLGTKLVSSFIAVSLIGLIISVIGIMGMSSIDTYLDKMYYKDLLGMSYVKQAQANRLDAGRRWRDILLAPTLEEKQRYAKQLDDSIHAYEENIKKGGELFYTDEGKKLVQEIQQVNDEWKRLTMQMAAMIFEQNLTSQTPEFIALRKLQEPKGKEIDSRIDKLNALKEEFATKTVKESSETYTKNLILMIVLVSLGFIVSVIIGIMFARYLMRQLGGEIDEAVKHVSQISDGNFSSIISLKPRDHSSLLYSLKNLQETINGFVAEQNLISEKHAQGFISHKIDDTKFKGTYAKMASEINQLVQSHIAVKMEVVDIVSQYAKGDFSRDISRLPEEKGKITVAIDSVKTALLKINKEIETIVAAGSQGDFSKRAHADEFEFMFKEMLTHLNELVETNEVGFNDVLRIANAIAQGDLTQQITKDYPGTFGKAKDAMNGTVENLKALLAEIRDSADTISTASQEIAAGNNDLSQRTERQAASLEETAASMQELTSTVQANSDNAKHANEMALSSSDIARKGVDVVNQVVSTMEDINESSRKIVDIITVIDGIAFQTNILALNAAVEAARAGEQGRGFAVVASEVRNLAQRAASAAGEIKGLISDSVDKVEDGTNLVARAGKTMEEIVNSIQGVTATITQITSASYEQTAGIQQVNFAIGEMDDVTQQNAALVEQAAAAAESLEDQARHLSITLNNFKIDDVQPTKSVAPAAKTYQPSSAPVKTVTKQAVAPVQEAIEPIDIDLDGALKKHADWKVKLRTAIANRETLDAETISKDNCCDFGKWLHSEDTHPHIAHLQSYHDCVERHADFHQVAGTIAHIINAKKYEDADRMLNDSNGDFIKNSGAVGSAIMRLKKDTKPKPAPVVKKSVEPATFSDDWEEF